MYLSKIELDRRNPQVVRAITDCQQMHRLVTEMFGTDRLASQVLYRTNLTKDKLNVYVYSKNPAVRLPACDIQQKDISFWVEKMEVGQIWNFDLIASPCNKVLYEGKKNSQRRLIRDPKERFAWLERKATQYGFKILSVQEFECVQVSGNHAANAGGLMHHIGYRYQGTLLITDIDTFKEALTGGIGPSKAYGFGMLMLKA